MENATDTTQPSLLLAWLLEFEHKRGAIGPAVDAFLEHLRRLPDPQSAADTQALLRFRRTQYRLNNSPLSSSHGNARPRRPPRSSTTSNAESKTRLSNYSLPTRPDQ
jgi:hypothetical protein